MADLGTSNTDRQQLAGDGRLASCEGSWHRGGIYEINVVPASRGEFMMHVVCLREVTAEGASGGGDGSTA